MAGRDNEMKRARRIFIRSFAAIGWKVHPNKNWYAYTQGLVGRMAGLLMRSGQGKLIGQMRAMLGQSAAGSADEKESGKSDLFIDADGRFLYVEVKWFEGTIVLSDWRENQREWMREHADQGNYYIAIMVEPTHDAVRARVGNASFFLVPAKAWLEMSEAVKSLPLSSDLAKSKSSVVALEVWKDYLLTNESITLSKGQLGFPNFLPTKGN